MIGDKRKMSEKFEIIERKDERYPPELGIPDEVIYKANIGKIIKKFKLKIEELENRIKKLEGK